MLEVCLLGSPEIKGNGHTLSVPRRQARALFYRLASRMDIVPREQLCFLFWPDLPECKARRNLSHLLTHVRGALPDRTILMTEDDNVWLDPKRVWSDTAVFAQLEEKSVSLIRQPQAIQQLIDLYRDSFLAGFSLPRNVEFEAWIRREQQVWERLYLAGLSTLVKAWTAQGAYETAIQCAERYLATNGLDEGVHNRLMALYAANGNRAAALGQFERCTAVLEQELGVHPLPETRAIYETIRKGHLPTDYIVAEQAWKILPYPHTPLVGRERPLQQLEQAFRCAQLGRGSVVLVSGEPGIGKSRLLHDFVTGLAGRATVLVGTGCSGARNLFYQPIVQALSPVINDVYATFKGELIWLAEATCLWPELRLSFSDLPQPTMGKSEAVRLRLFESLYRIILDMSHQTPCVVLCLDDLHWMDGVTLEWLVYLGHRLRGMRLLVLGSYCCDEAEVMVDLNHNLARLDVLTEISLSGLNETAVYQLLHHLSGSTPSMDTITYLNQLTGGNPFLLLEIIQSLQETDHDLANLPRRLGYLSLSSAICEAIANRLAHLSLVARQILEASAILPPYFVFDQIHQLAGRREMETMDGLEELVHRQLLLQEDVHYRFRYALTQQAVLESLNPVRYQLLCRRADRFGIATPVN